MKLLSVLPLVVAAQAIALPDDIKPKQLIIESHDHSPSANEPWWGEPSAGYVSAIEQLLDDMVESAGQTIDNAMQGIEKMGKTISHEIESLLDGNHDNRRHGRHGRHGRKEFDEESDKSIWELLKESKSTQRFYKLVGEHEDIKKRLKDTDKEYTLFAPTDQAFEDMPDHEKPSKEFLEEILEYHIVRGNYPISKVITTNTLPTVLELQDLGDRCQRLRVSAGLTGVHLNFYSKIVATNLMARNGVIHAVNRVLIPPPRQGRLIASLPGRFSTLSLAMEKTTLGEDLHRIRQRGGTIFAPTNDAFVKLGPRMNDFLFSPEGLKYLRALLKYHVVTNETLYSDAFYEEDDDRDRHGRRDGDQDREEEDRRRHRDHERNRRRHRNHGGRGRRDTSEDNWLMFDMDEDRHHHDRHDHHDDRRHHWDSEEEELDRRHHSRRHHNRNRHHGWEGLEYELELLRGGRRGRDQPHRGRNDRDQPRRRHGRHGSERDLWELLDREGSGGDYQVDLPSVLGEGAKEIAVDIRRWLGIINMTVNGWIKVSVLDGISQDGVVHVVDSVLMPPRQKYPDVDNPEDDYENDNMTVDDLKERLEAYVDDGDDQDHRNSLKDL